MSLKKVIGNLDLELGANETSEIKKETSEIIKRIKEILKKEKIDADVFLGGSFAKNTALKGKSYDVDLFIRFDDGDPAGLLERIVGKLKGEFNVINVHGSRDYIRIEGRNALFEVIPVIKIKKPKDAVNVTDLSYFHVAYVNKKLKKNKKLIREILAMKAFCKANNVYGAESYINGFSGYAIECLIIYYGSFEKLIKAFLKAKEKIIIDQEKLYKNKSEILIELNESKLKCPIVLIDPTWKERNVLAALNEQSFSKFKEVAKRLLAKPNESFFQIREKPFSLKNKKNNILVISIETDRQEGDIAGTKLKKFCGFIKNETSKYFDVEQDKFEYDYGKKAKYYLELKSKKEIIKKGPPVSMKKEAEIFKKKNKNCFVKDKIVYSKIKVDFSPKDFIDSFYKKNRKQIRQMDITDLKTG